MTIGEIISICALCVSAIVGLFAILTFMRNGSKDVKQETKENSVEAERRGYEKGQLNAKLDAISNGIAGIREEIKSVKDNVDVIDSCLTNLKPRVITLEREMHEVRTILGMNGSEPK